METTDCTSRWKQFEEPLQRTLLRNLAIAFVVGVIVASLRRSTQPFLPTLALALWPSLGGHFVELAFLNFVRYRIPAARPWQALARLCLWYAGGCALYLCMSGSAHFLPFAPLPLSFLPWSGLAFMGIELLAHAFLALRGQPSFYDGRA
jgi:hypothetical protein